MPASQNHEALAGGALDPAARVGTMERVAQHLVLLAVLLVLAWLSLAILGPDRIAPIWPANGVLLAVLLRSPRRSWPGWLIAGFIGVSAGAVANGGEVATTLGLAIWNLVEVSLCASLIRLVGGVRPDITRLRVLVAGGAAALFSAATGACGVALFLGWLGRPDALASAVVWTLADGLGQMIAAPLVLVLTRFKPPSAMTTAGRLGALMAAVALAIVVAAVFGQSRYHLLFLIFAPLLVLVFQLEFVGAALGVMLTAVLAVTYTVSGHGPLMRYDASQSERIILLQVFLLAAVVVSFPLAAVLADRRRAQDSVSASEGRLKFLSDFSRDVVIRLSLDRRILDVSPSCRRYGYEPQELIGAYGAELNHPDDRAQVTALFDEVAEGCEADVSATREWRARAKDGGWIPMEGHVTVVRKSNGEPSEFVLVIRDIKERKAAVEALARSEARYRFLAENSRDLVMQFDADATITYASASARLFGYKPEDLVGRNTFDLIHPSDVGRVKRAVAASVNPPQDGDEGFNEWRFRDASGHYVWMEGNPSASRDATGGVVSYRDSLRDIRRRKALEEDLSRKRAEAEASEAARRVAEAEARERLQELARVARALTVGEFATSIAHELNQPIAAVVTNSDASLRWLSHDPPNLDEVRAAIMRTIRDANRASAVIERTRAMISKRPAVLAALDCNDCIEETLQFAEAELRRNGVTVRKRFNAKPLTANGDKVQLQQVLLNLIRNGIEAMRDNGDQARVLTITSELNAAGEIQISVADTGPGLDPEVARGLFDRLFTTKVDGVGLGLPIARSIIEAHGGRLWAGSAPGGGAIFHFTLQPAGTP